jgi:hypothetical protein
MKWRNNIKMTRREKYIILLLRKHGCKCELPLIGYHESFYVRCRLCGVEVKTKEFQV